MSTNTNNQVEKNAAIQRIVGAHLTSVEFVIDYLILGFGPHGALTVLVWPEIIHDKIASRFGHEGYRDKLCSLIGGIVKNTTIDSDDVISISFENGAHMRIPLKMKTFGERAILTGTNHYLFVF